jgi:hypothetical protein
MNKNIDHQFDRLTFFIEEGNKLLATGQSMELSGLEEQIDMLCGAVMDLPEVERVQYQERLTDLLNELTKLGKGLIEHHRDIVEELQSLPSQKKANIAYKTADSRDNFGKRDGEK